LKIDENLDLVIFRENTDDVYVGIEFEQGKPETQALIDMLRKTHPKENIPNDIGISIKPISEMKAELDETHPWCLGCNGHAGTAVTPPGRRTMGLHFRGASGGLNVSSEV